jgi:2-dehydro-3-deoxygluconokinase
MAAARIVCFGEVLWRFATPAGQLLLQQPRLEVSLGGAEANVAVSLARFGHSAVLASILPENALGRAALDELRRYGVDTSHIQFAPGRMGLYFLTPGAALRPAEILYDRAQSAFATASPEAIDWDRVLEGAVWLHISGVTPALGANGASAAVCAAQAARRRQVMVSFDGNYRAKLWGAWNGDAPAILKSLMETADLAFVDERDVALILKQECHGAPEERCRAAAKAAFAAFPQLKRLASTSRTKDEGNDYELSAALFTRDNEHRTRTFKIRNVVDRIGSGDAFAAGLLHGLQTKMSDSAALDFALAAACLKHSVPGDFNLVRETDVRELLAGDSPDVKR